MKISSIDPAKIKSKQKIKITETDIKKQVKDYLSVKGWFHFHLLAGLGCYPGACDMIACKGGQVLFLEIKKPKGTQSEHQKEFQARMQHVGCRYLLVRGIEDLQKEGI